MYNRSFSVQGGSQSPIFISENNQIYQLHKPENPATPHRVRSILPKTCKLNYLINTFDFQLCKENSCIGPSYLITLGSNNLDLSITGRKGQQFMRNNNAVLTKPKNVICRSGSVLTVLGLGASLIVISMDSFEMKFALEIVPQSCCPTVGEKLKLLQ